MAGTVKPDLASAASSSRSRNWVFVYTGLIESCNGFKPSLDPWLLITPV